jgi:hypothetical protein
MLVRLVRDMEARARAEGHESGFAWFLDQVRDGLVMRKIAAPLGVSRQMMYNYLKHMDRETNGESTRQDKAALIESGTSHAQDAVEIVDEPANDSVSVQRNRERAGVRMKLAAALDRETYGQKTAETQLVVLGELHITALQQAGGPQHQLPRGQGEDVVDAEVEAEAEDVEAFL